MHHVPRNNGNVGLWGISYPGFYASWGAVDAHPAVKAISPQAPVTDWFAGDDFHHNGAFFLVEAYMFMRHFGVARPTPVDWEADVAPFRAGDLYDYFLSVGTVAALDSTFLHGAIGFWNELVKHGTLDDFWRARDVRPYLKRVRPAVLTVGGWFDAEDLHGTLSTYHTIERQNPGLENELVMGPWQHGGWARHDGETLGDVKFDGKTSRWFASEVLLPFFERTLRGAPGSRPAEATVFETGTNEWRRYDAWPPKKATQATLWLAPHGHLVTRVPKDSSVESYVSDPARPVPYAERYDLERGVEYMDADQRYAARRPDVRTWTSAPLADEVVLAGPMEADLWISSTGTDADFVVKVVDVFPGDLEPPPGATSAPLAGRQQLVRLEVMRAKFRDSLSSPRALVPDEPTHVRFSLPDVSHAFRAGHRVMVQVQSSWFPIVDRNPQRFMDIYAAKPDDFHAETERVMEGGARASSLRVSVVRGVLP